MMKAIKDKPLPVIDRWYDDVTAPHYKKIALLFAVSAVVATAPWAVMALMAGISLKIIAGNMAVMAAGLLLSRYLNLAPLPSKLHEFTDYDHPKVSVVKEIIREQLSAVGKSGRVILVDNDKHESAADPQLPQMGYAGSSRNTHIFSINRAALNTPTLSQLAANTGHEAGHCYERTKEVLFQFSGIEAMGKAGAILLPFVTLAFQTSFAGTALVSAVGAYLMQTVGQAQLLQQHEYLGDYRGAQINGGTAASIDNLEEYEALDHFHYPEYQTPFRRFVNRLFGIHPSIPDRVAALHRIESLKFSGTHAAP